MAAEVSINYLAVLVAAIASMVIGGVWYSPMVFGKLWMKLSGLDEKALEEGKKKGMAKMYAVAFLGTLVMSYVLAHFVDYAGATDLVSGLQLGFWVWLGFIATVLLGSVLWEGKSVKLYLLNNAHYVVSLLVMSVILAMWP